MQLPDLNLMLDGFYISTLMLPIKDSIGIFNYSQTLLRPFARREPLATNGLPSLVSTLAIGIGVFNSSNCYFGTICIVP